MTDYNMSKQLQMWKDTNFGPQMQQLKQAGLNPGLIYGMGGGGGQTANIETGHVGTSQPTRGSAEAMAAAGMGMQLQLLQAQKENIQADTENKKATTPKIQAEAENLKADTGNIKADTAIKEIQEHLTAIQDYVAGATQNQAIAMAMTQLRTATAQMDILERENDINAQTKQTKIQQIRAELAGMLAENALKQSGTAVNIERIKQIKQDIINSINQIDINATDVDIKRKLQEFETDFGKQYGQFAAILARLLGK